MLNPNIILIGISFNCSHWSCCNAIIMPLMVVIISQVKSLEVSPFPAVCPNIWPWSWGSDGPFLPWPLLDAMKMSSAAWGGQTGRTITLDNAETELEQLSHTTHFFSQKGWEVRQKLHQVSCAVLGLTWGVLWDLWLVRSCRAVQPGISHVQEWNYPDLG